MSNLEWAAKTIQDVLGVTEEEWRKLRKKLGPMQGRDGRKQPYADADLLALLVVTTVWRALQVPPEGLALAAHEIWRLCRANLHPHSGRGTFLILAVENGSPVVQISSDPDRQYSFEISLTVALAPLSERMRIAALDAPAEAQRDLFE